MGGKASCDKASFFSKQQFPRYSLGHFLEVTLQPLVWRLITLKLLILYEDNFISFNSQSAKDHFDYLGFSFFYFDHMTPFLRVSLTFSPLKNKILPDDVSSLIYHIISYAIIKVAFDLC